MASALYVARRNVQNNLDLLLTILIFTFADFFLLLIFGVYIYITNSTNDFGMKKRKETRPKDLNDAKELKKLIDSLCS